MNRKAFFLTITTALLVIATGCAWNTKKDTIESKSKAVMFTVTSLVLNNNPTNAEVRQQFATASSELKFLAAQDTVDVLTILAVIQALPQTKGDTEIIVTGAILFFSSELESFAVENPAEVRSAAKGCAAGIDAALGITVPPAVSSPAWRYTAQRRTLQQTR